MSLPLRVLGDRVLIKPDIEDQAVATTDSGLLTAISLAAAVEGTDREVSYVSGTVIALGTVTPCAKCGRVTRDLAIGNRVAFSWKAGQDVELDGEPFVILKESEVLAILMESA